MGGIEVGWARGILMEERRHKCKVCLKRFWNGRALGGHMRSHMVNGQDAMSEGGDSAPLLWSPSSSSSSASSEEEEDKGLRENPKRSVRMVDPEFSWAASVVVQDRESETESSKNPTRRRSKRNIMKKEPWAEAEADAEAVSSISATTTEEDVAFWLMMLSRDKWTTTTTSDDADESSGLKLSKKHKRGNYECETCNKVFGSYQALGGHRASHKKIKALDHTMKAATSRPQIKKKIHECPVCFRVFASGQALGGHKRSHVGGFTTPLKIPPTNFRQSFIDLNLPPAPLDEDDHSALSDAHFVNNNNATTH